MWKNKHVIAAMIIAPMLAVITYFAIDHMVSERPHAAKAGASYPLLAKSNCRYASGECDLENSDFKLSLTREHEPMRMPRLHMVSTHPLHGAHVAFAANVDDDVQPIAMEAQDDSARIWSLALDEMPLDMSLRLVVIANQSSYFAEVPTVFFERPPERSR